jgi:hypothetical protein
MTQDDDKEGIFQKRFTEKETSQAQSQRTGFLK